MIDPELLIIGNISETFHLGSILARAAQQIGVPFAGSDTSWNNYAPSMSYLWGRAFFKLTGKRPLEWWSFNKKTARLVEELKPNLIVVTGIFPLENNFFEISNELGAKIVNYLTDYPWNTQNYCSHFIANLSKYDCIFSTKKEIIPELLNANVKQVCFLPFAFDPILHYQLSSGNRNNEQTLVPDVCLIGGADRERITFIKKFKHKFEGQLGLYGDYWSKDKDLKPFARGKVLGDDFCRTVRNCRVNVGLVRRANKDGHSMRSYEIAACGGVGIYEDTPEHRDLFKGYPDYGFFTSPEDLAIKCNWLLENPLKTEEMRQLGIEIVVKDSNTYTARLQTILNY